MAIRTNIPETMIPGFYGEFEYYVGPNGLPANNQKILLVGDATGALAVNKPTAVYTEQEKTALAGDGSVLGQMYDAAKKAWKYSQISFLRHAAPAGTAATWEIGLDFVDGEASAAKLSGIIQITVGAVIVSAKISAGNTLGDIAAAIVTEINARTNLPVTASAEDDIVTLTAKNVGKYISDGVQVSASIVAADIDAVVTANTGVGTINIEEALKSAFAERFHIIAISVSDSANLLLLRDHLERAAAPLEQRGQRGVSTIFIGGATAGITLAKSLNHERISLAAVKNSIVNSPWEISGGIAAIFASNSKPNIPMNSRPIPGLAIPDVVDKWSGEEQDALLYGGLIPLIDESSYLCICRAVTTKSENNGARFTKLIDTGIIASADYSRDAVIATLKAKYKNKVLHRLLLSAIREDIVSVSEILEQEQIQRNVEDHLDEFIVEESTDEPGRALTEIPTHIVPGLNQIYNRFLIYV